MALKYQRILLKISGEALGGEKGTGFDEPTMDAICGGVKKAHELGVQIGIVVGGGNFWRGRSSGRMERTLADKIGMLATVMNALAVSDKLEQLGVPTEVFTSITMPQVAPAFTRKDALRAMDEGKIAIFGLRYGQTVTEQRQVCHRATGNNRSLSVRQSLYPSLAHRKPPVRATAHSDSYREWRME